MRWEPVAGLIELSRKANSSYGISPVSLASNNVLSVTAMALPEIIITTSLGWKLGECSQVWTLESFWVPVAPGNHTGLLFCCVLHHMWAQGGIFFTFLQMLLKQNESKKKCTCKVTKYEWTWSERMYKLKPHHNQSQSSLKITIKMFPSCFLFGIFRRWITSWYNAFNVFFVPFVRHKEIVQRNDLPAPSESAAAILLLILWELTAGSPA